MDLETIWMTINIQPPLNLDEGQGRGGVGGVTTTQSQQILLTYRRVSLLHTKGVGTVSYYHIDNIPCSKKLHLQKSSSAEYEIVLYLTETL